MFIEQTNQECPGWRQVSFRFERPQVIIGFGKLLKWATAWQEMQGKTIDRDEPHKDEFEKQPELALLAGQEAVQVATKKPRRKLS
jgi:hypothetical protein